jgi:hypothetical protein
MIGEELGGVLPARRSASASGAAVLAPPTP